MPPFRVTGESSLSARIGQAIYVPFCVQIHVFLPQLTFVVGCDLLVAIVACFDGLVISNLKKEGKMLTKRQLLQYAGSVAGAAGVYRTMAALGMLGVSSLTGCTSPASSQGPGDGKRVVILGAGIAGLTAAYELSEEGYTCEILEATSRAGGRNLTARGGDVLEEISNSQQVEFDEEAYLYANMGPARIPYHHETMLGYCKQFGVELEVFTNDNRAAFFHGSVGMPVTARQFYTDQRGYIAELLTKAVNGGNLDSELTGDDKENLLAMLRSFGALDDNDMYSGSSRAGTEGEYLHLGLGLGNEATQVAHHSLKEVLGMDFDSGDKFYPIRFTQGLDQNPTLFQPVGGMDRIVDAFKREVRANGVVIYYDTVVEEIMKMTDGGVTIRASDNSSSPSTPWEMDYDYAICTIPAPVLDGIRNNFAERTKDVIRATKFSKAFKIAFQAPRRFWEEDHHIYGGISWTSFNGVTQIWYPSYGYHKPKGVILGAYSFGEPGGWGKEGSKIFAPLTPAQRLEKAIEFGEDIHPYYREMLTEQGRLNGVSRVWSEVPYQLGGWPLEGTPALNPLRDANG